MDVVKRSVIAPDTILKFPGEIVTYRHGKEVVVVSPKDGNWLVVTEYQLQILEQLKTGITIGEVLSNATDKGACLTLLKQLTARNFTEKGLSVADRDTKAMFYLTYDCNLQCEHCYMHAQRRRMAALSVEEYRCVFGGIRAGGAEEVTFSGGEPLVRSDFWQIADAAYQKGLSLKIFSNGTLWSDTDIDNAKTYGAKVQISIDGVDEKSCAIVRGANVFEKAKDTALILANAGIDVEIATTPVLANMEAIERGYADFVNEMRDRSGQKIKFKVSLNLLPGRNISRLTASQKQEYEQRGIRLYTISNSGGSQIPFFDEYRNGRARIACGIGRLVFSPDGFVYVCSRPDSFPVLGNVRDVDVSYLLVEARRRLAAASVDNTIPCRECPLRHICGGGCRADRYERVSINEEVASVHKPCSEAYKNALIKMMVQATRECYTWG